MPTLFRSRLEKLGTIPPLSDDEIRDLPPLFWADTPYFLRRCGRAARAFVDALPPDFRDAPLNYFNRLERLETGWYPNAPHYHIDGCPQVPGAAPGVRDYKSGHAMETVICTLGDVAPTTFLLGDIELADPGPHEVTFDRWTEEIAKRLRAGELSETRIEPFTLYRFGFGALHRSSAATRPGWRYLIHATRGTGVTPYNSDDFQVELQLIPRSRCKHTWPQDTQIPRRQ